MSGPPKRPHMGDGDGQGLTDETPIGSHNDRSSVQVLEERVTKLDNEMLEMKEEFFKLKKLVGVGVATGEVTAGPKPNDRVVYVPGVFDLLHQGHLAFLEEAKKLGDYLCIGLYDDKTSQKISQTDQTPIMNEHERMIALQKCRLVDGIVIGPDFDITEQFLKQHKVTVVCHGMSSKVTMGPDANEDPYKIPREAGILQEIDSGSQLTTEEIIGRVLAKRDQFEKRNKDKEAEELARIALIHQEK